MVRARLGQRRGSFEGTRLAPAMRALDVSDVPLVHFTRNARLAASRSRYGLVRCDALAITFALCNAWVADGARARAAPASRVIAALARAPRFAVTGFATVRHLSIVTA